VEIEARRKKKIEALGRRCQREEIKKSTEIGKN
jgi:hypothetical protein